MTAIWSSDNTDKEEGAHKVSLCKMPKVMLLAKIVSTLFVAQALKSQKPKYIIANQP